MRLAVYMPMALSPLMLSSQLTLDRCVELARENYPLVRQYELIRRTENATLSDIGKSWLPRIGAYAQATAQNDVPEFPSGIFPPALASAGFDMPGMRKDQYKVGIDLNQTIWDGGKSAADRTVARNEARRDEMSNDVELYALEERIEILFFGILLTKSQIRQNALTETLLRSNADKLQSMLRNGTAMQSDVDAIEAELLTVRQRTISLQSSAGAYRRMLGMFIGEQVDSLILPGTEMPRITDGSDRPELRLFAAEQATVEARKKLIRSSLMPRIGLFAQAFYGYPGFDYFRSMTSRDWSFNAMAGIKLSWNIDSFYSRKNSLAQLDNAESRINVAKDLFLFNNRLNAIEQDEEIQRLLKTMEDDERIVRLRTSVRQAAESRLTNGVIDTTGLLSKITDEANASANADYHRIQLVKAIYRLRHTINK